ncbi:putative F-box protein At3g10240 [Bidens hawaiensis]|uniref:putative F-box protein At3g10240 n=1 Tax=Bidens hawaiensis TaxID=980011 RepID=UPI004048EC0E
METLGQRATANTSVPDEIIEEILLRLPVKSILRFRSLSKPWLTRINHPSFTKRHLTRAHRTAFFIAACNYFTRNRHFLSAATDGGPVTHLITLDGPCYNYPHDLTEAEHLNGLVFFTHLNYFMGAHVNHAFLINPSTRNILKLPDPDAVTNIETCYFFGFDESRNEHKVLLMRKELKSVMIFSTSTHAWRTIHAELPIGFCWDRFCVDFFSQSVCVNSVVHRMLEDSLEILAFDLRTEKFSIIKPPQGVLCYDFKGEIYPLYIIKVNDCIAVCCYDEVTETEMHIWILQDYENRVWVRQVINIPEPSNDQQEFPFPVASVNMDEIIFYPCKLSRNVVSVPTYNKKNRCLKSLQFTSGHQFHLPNLKFDQIRCYVESMVPL